MSSSPRIILIQYPGLSPETTSSPPCGKVHMALRFKGLQYETRNVRDPRQARRYNQRGRVPALQIDGEIIVDSTDIVTELESRFPEPPLEPEEPVEKARAKMLEDWADEVLYFYGVYARFAVPENFERLRRQVFAKLPAPLRWVVPTIARHLLRQRMSGQGVGLKPADVVRRETTDCIRSVSTLLSAGPWLVGKRLSRADIAVCACLDQYRIRAITPALAEEIESYPTIVEWAERVHQVAPAAC